jgi:NitT/TauT family transport system substrate-binding protein
MEEHHDMAIDQRPAMDQGPADIHTTSVPHCRGGRTLGVWLDCAALRLSMLLFGRAIKPTSGACPRITCLKSGYLEKHAIAAEEFAVPSGNLTMQQMVARQVDLGTYAGQSFIIGNAKGGLVAIALIEHVGKTARITTRKDLNITKVEELRGRRIANQTGSSVGNVFVDTIMPQHGLNKGDYVEVRMDVNNMVAALAAKTVDAMVNVEPYNVIAVADGIGSDLLDFSGVDPMPVFMAATPDFVQSKPDTVIAYLKAWLDVAGDFKNAPQKVADVIYKFYADKGYTYRSTPSPRRSPASR